MTTITNEASIEEKDKVLELEKTDNPDKKNAKKFEKLSRTEIYDIFSNLLYDIDSNSVMRGFYREGLDVSKKQDRIKFIFRTLKTLRKSAKDDVDFEKDQNKMSKDFFYLMTKKMYPNTVKDVTKETITNGYFYRLGLDYGNIDDTVFLMKLLEITERENILNKKMYQKTIVGIKKGELICPHCGNGTFQKLGKTTTNKERFICKNKKCRKVLVPSSILEKGVNKKISPLDTMEKIYNIKADEKLIFAGYDKNEIFRIIF